MLSAETSAGMYPVEAVKAMVKIVVETEKYPQIYHRKVKVPKGHSERQITDSIVASAARLSKDAEVNAIITHTLSGYSAFKLASHRPFAKIFIFSHERDLLNKLNLVWGVKGFYYDHLTSSEQALADMPQILLNSGHLAPNDLVIQMAGFPILEKAKSNMLMLKSVTVDDKG
jgi:pyruvate kinase